jgi:hypothetical protein
MTEEFVSLLKEEDSKEEKSDNRVSKMLKQEESAVKQK